MGDVADLLAVVEDEPLAVREVPGVAERDERIVVDPGSGDRMPAKAPACTDLRQQRLNLLLHDISYGSVKTGLPG